MKINAYLMRSTVVAALGGLLFGFDTAVIAGTTSGLTAAYQLTKAHWCHRGLRVARHYIWRHVGRHSWRSVWAPR